jgi:hypothetical protein
VTQVIDERGQVLGRFNAIDFAAIVVVIVLIPMGYVAWRVVRQPVPVIESVTPSTLTTDPPVRVRMRGEHFRPYLNAFLLKTNEPHSIPQRVSDNARAEFLVETPTEVELQLPDLDPGTYDIYLYDEGRELAHKTAAVTLTLGERPPRQYAGLSVPDGAIVEFIVRFTLESDLASLVNEGAVELNRPERGSPATTPAKLVSVRKVSAKPASASTPATTVIEAVVRAGVTRDHGLWVYPEGQRIRAGETFWFGTADYIVDGLITRIVAANRVQP